MGFLGWTYDLEGVGDNSDSHELLSVVAAVVHQRVGQSLNDGAVGLAESLCSITASSVGDVDGVSQGNVVTIRRPSVSIPLRISQVFEDNFFRVKTYVREMSRTSTS